MSEADFLFQLVGDSKHPGLVPMLGWSYVHFRPAQTEKGWRTPVSGPLGKGWPDLFLARARGKDRRIIFAELKREGGKLSLEQEHVRDLLLEVGLSAGLSGAVIRPDFRTAYPQVDYYLWRPSDFDAIAEVLR
jgi:hypothetical protein